MNRFYILPIQVVGSARGPKYLKWRYNRDSLDVRWGMIDYGLINAALVAADVTQEQHEQIAAEIDVAAAPADIDQNVSEIAIPKVANVLEELRIPAGWIDTTYTYRDVLRTVAGLFQFAQAYHGQHDEALIDDVAALNLRWNQIPTAGRARITATADSLDYDYADVKNTWTVRRILKHLADQWGDSTFYIGGAVL